MIHDILLPLTSLFLSRPRKLLLILRQNEIISPAILSARVLWKTTIRRPVNRLGNTVDISTVIPLKVLLEMDLEVAMLIGRAAYSVESRLAARGTELLVHLFCDLEAAVAA